MDDFSKALKNGEAITYDKALKLGNASREALERRRAIGCDIASNNPEFWRDHDRYVDDLIRKAHFGDSNAGLELIKQFIETLDHNSPLNKYMADCLLDVVAKKDPRESLNIKAINRPKKDNTKRDLEIYRQIQSRINSGMSVLDAQEDYRGSENNTDNLSIESLKKIYLYCKPIIKRQQKQSF
jgi:hypothetical protein